MENSKTEHDEALLLAAGYENSWDIRCNLTNYIVLQNLQTFTKKYVSDAWYDKIIWSVELFNYNKTFYNVSDCVVLKFDFKNLIVPGVVFFFLNGLCSCRIMV